MAEAKKSNKFAIWVTIVAVAVIAAVIAAVVLMNNALRGEVNTLNQGNQTDGKQVVQVYVDFMCSHCKNFEDTFAGDIEEINAGDSTVVETVPVAIMDRVSPDAYSTRAANAAFCVADENPSGVAGFMASVFAVQPTTTADPFPSNDDLIAMASENGAEGIADCVNNLEHEADVKNNTRAMPANPETGQRGTPTLTLDGEYFSQLDFQAQVADFK